MDKKNKIKAVYLIAAAVTFIYVFIRAFNMDITYDEAWTITDFASLDVWGIITYEPCDANNHMINTLLIKLFFLSGSDSLFVARLPNVLACILYIYFTYKIVNKHLSPVMALGCYLLLLLNPFVLDFFSIARGYGLSMGFLIASLYYMISYVNEHKTSQVLWTIAFGILTVLSNFSTLNYWLVFCLVINLIALFNKGLNFKRTFFLTFSGSVILALIV
ncbi:MAG: glycosyltransferase family 39 protein, partial [Bacteroidota bacterium]